MARGHHPWPARQRWGFALGAALLALVSTGCITPNQINALANNPASVDVDIRTPWGAATVRRRNPCACLNKGAYTSTFDIPDLDPPTASTSETARPR